MSFATNKVSIPRRSAAVALMRLAAGASGLGDALLRPQEIRRLADGAGPGTEALVERIVPLGAELRAQLKLADGSAIWGRVSREDAEQLELRKGQILTVSLATAGDARRPLARAA